MAIVGSAPALDEKVLRFFCMYLSRFLITKFVIMETLLSSIIFKTIMAQLHRGRFLVVHLHSSFSMDLLVFPLGANLYQKLPFLAIFVAGSPYFKSHNGKIWREGADPSPY